MKFYTDPSFFFNLWMQSMIQFPSNHNGHRSGKHERYRHQQQKLHHQESIYASNPTSSSQSRLIRQTSEEQYYQQQYRNPQDLIRHRNDFDQIARGTIRSQQQIYSPPNHRQPLQYSNNNHLNHHPDLVQYGSPAESSSNIHNGYKTEQSPRLNVNSPVITRQAPAPPPLLSQFEPANHHAMMKQTIARPAASPPPPPPPPPPSAPAFPVWNPLLL
jgi:hypothetical protein